VTARERLPNRRASESFTFEVGGLTYTATITPGGRLRSAELRYAGLLDPRKEPGPPNS
jgi:hypothetical protein